MFKKILLTLALLIPIAGFTQEVNKATSPMSSYKDNYIIFGGPKDQVVFQFSAKFNIVYPYEILYFAYSQKSWWKLYDASSPFYETNFIPETFVRFESGNNPFNNFIIPIVDFIQLSPWFHRSNGREAGEHNRGENKYYGEIQLSYGDVYNFGIRGKVFGYYSKSKDNKDINNYHKYYEAETFFKLRSKTVKYLDKEELSFKFGGNPFDKGWYSFEFKVRLLTTYIQPRFFVQYFDGYDQFIINYNKRDRSLRAGIAFIN